MVSSCEELFIKNLKQVAFFRKSTNNDELEHNILTFEEKRYKEDCKRHYEALGGCETGRAAQLVCRWISDKCFPKETDV